MKKLTIRDLFKNSDAYVNKEICIEGWIKTLRDSKTFGFLELNDGSFFKNIQIVFDDSLSNFSDICKLTISSSIKVTGTFIKTVGNKQPFEVKATNITFYNII